MNKIILIVVIAAFAVLSGKALFDHGYIGIFEYHFPSTAGWQVIADLVIVCALAMLWMVKDAKAKGRNPWPFVVITIAAGAFGPLLYLLLGGDKNSA